MIPVEPTAREDFITKDVRGIPNDFDLDDWAAMRHIRDRPKTFFQPPQVELSGARAPLPPTYEQTSSFRAYPDFDDNPEFVRLANTRNWKVGDREGEKKLNWCGVCGSRDVVGAWIRI